MFSIIIPLYNKELSVKNTIQSVLDQTFQEFEIVIVNDGSTDKSADIVEQINDSRIRLIHQENQGVSAARNKGIEEAKYEWIAFLDADDLWRINHLTTLKDMISKYQKDNVFTTSFIRSNEDENVSENNNIEVIENYFKEALKCNVTWTSVICVNKKVLDDVGVFNVQFNRGEDLDLWARIAREYRFVKSNLVTAIYRIEGENRTNKSYPLISSDVFYYDLDSVKTEDELIYYKNRCVKKLRMFLGKLDVTSFIRLKLRYNRFISFSDIFRSRKEIYLK